VLYPRWLSGSESLSINVPAQRRARLVPGWVNRLRADKSSRYVTSHTDQLSLAVPPWTDTVSSGESWKVRVWRCTPAQGLAVSAGVFEDQRWDQRRSALPCGST